MPVIKQTSLGFLNDPVPACQTEAWLVYKLDYEIDLASRFGHKALTMLTRADTDSSRQASCTRKRCACQD